MGLFPKEIKEYLATLGIPRGPDSNVYLVDTEQGSDSNPGDRWTKPLASLEAAYALTVADQHDTVLFLSRDTADNPTASITWDKDFTHLIGLSGNLPGVGQRCRVVGTAALDLTPVITFGGKGNIVRNMQFYNGKDANTDGGCVVLTGDRYEFTNVFFAGMANTTPAARPGAYSLGLAGAHENIFTDCTIGLDTILRAAANAELVMTESSSKNVFRRCRFHSYSETAGKFLVQMNVPAGGAGINTWEDCLFYNLSANWAHPLDNAFNITGVGGTYYVDLARCRLVGVTGWADVVTHVYSSDPQPNAGFGVPANPTT
jgi:hypothetical protein